MESSKIFEGEECKSSESGWTTYIGSPVHGDDDDDDDDGDSKFDDYADDGDAKDDHSDDSMASDASSGPSLQGSLYGNVKDGHVISHFKHDEVYVGKSYFHQKTEKSLMEKQKVGLGMRKKEEKEEKSSKAKRSFNATTSQSGSKVGKSLWLGSRK